MLKKNLIRATVGMLLLTLCCILPINSKVEASNSVSISSSKTSVEEGETFKITISSGLIGRVDISASGNVTLSADRVFIDKNSESITVTAKSSGNVTITATPLDGKMSDGNNDIEVSSSSCSVTITAKPAPTPEPEPTPEPTPDPTPNPTPDPEPTFRSVNETVYVDSTTTINVRSSYNTTSKVVGSLKTGESVTRTGIGSNGWSRVSFNGSTAYIKSSLLTTEKPEDKPLEEPTTTKSNNTNLKSLNLKVEGLTPKFDNNVQEYTLKLETKVEQLEVIAIAEDTKSAVKIEGNTSMTEGENKIIITVTAEDGTIKKYTIKVANGVTEVITGENTGVQLKKLEIKGINIGTVFNPEIYEYKVIVKDISSLEITTQANQEDAKIEILGNKDFKDGENIITIVVKSKDGTQTATYQIIVERTTAVGKTGDSNWKIFAIIGGVIALLIIIAVVIIIIKRRRDSGNVYEDEEEVENLEYQDKYAEFEDTEELFEKEETPKRDNWFEDEIEEEDTASKRRRGKHF